MSKNLLDSNTVEMTDLEERVLTCARVPRSEWQSSPGNRLGAVRTCAGFPEEAEFAERVLGGLCGGDPEEGSDLSALCNSLASTAPDARSVIRREVLGGISILMEDGFELALKEGGDGKWKPILYIPPSGLSGAEPGEDVEAAVERYTGMRSVIDHLNGEATLPTLPYPSDKFGAALRNIVDGDFVDISGCYEGDTCLKLTEKGYGTYVSLHRGKGESAIPASLTGLIKEGGVSMEFESLLTGLEKSGSASRQIYLLGSAPREALQEMSRHGVDTSHFNVESTGRMELKNITAWAGRSVRRMIDEIEEYEKMVAELGFTRPECPTIMVRKGGRRVAKMVGGTHLTFSPPVTAFDRRHKDQWELFLNNWLRLSQWWEPAVLSVSGSPVKYWNAPPEWIHSIRHHRSYSVKAGTARVHPLTPGDGAVGVFGTGRIPWHEKARRLEGWKDPGSDRTDLRARRSSIVWTGASEEECARATQEGSIPPELRDLCRSQSDQAVELRFFEYEPLPNTEERAEVVPLLMDRAYQLASQGIEVPWAGDEEVFNSVMWKMMIEGYEADLTEEEAMAFSKIFTGDEGKISPDDDLEEVGRKIIDELWEDHYDDFFTTYFGVDNKPTHVNYMRKCKEWAEEQSQGGDTWVQVSDAEYGRGGRIP
jgi:hypothetical protein